MNESVIVYKLKDGVLINDIIEKLDYQFLPFEFTGGNEIMAKQVIVPNDSQPVLCVIDVFNKFINNFKKIEEAKKYLSKANLNVEEFFKDDGTSEFQICLDENFFKLASSWRLEFNLSDDGWLGFTTGDMTFPLAFYNSTILKQYCEKEIKELFENDFIEELEVKNEG